MKIETKFDLDQYVYTVRHYRKEYREVCPICHGKGEVTIEGETFDCPGEGCWGNGYITKLTPKDWKICEHSQVGKIGIEVKKDSYKEYYMLKATGIDSGTLWYDDLEYGTRLFATKKEAETFCSEMNTIFQDSSRVTEE